jgi:hypothetical protein
MISPSFPAAGIFFRIGKTNARKNPGGIDDDNNEKVLKKSGCNRIPCGNPPFVVTRGCPEMD